eukprot:m.42155 g.42155  ORF g.42155 m.42155 type:complete len:351 (-) comp12862_c0_seq2:149-1201(-)
MNRHRDMRMSVPDWIPSSVKMSSKKADHICPLCARSFRRSDHLRQHVISHFDCRPHECNECSKRYRQSFSLSRHQADTGHSGRTKHPVSAEELLAKHRRGEIKTLDNNVVQHSEAKASKTAASSYPKRASDTTDGQPAAKLPNRAMPSAMPPNMLAAMGMPWLSTALPDRASSTAQSSLVAMQAQLAMQLQQRAYMAALQSALMSAAFRQTLSTQAAVTPSLNSQVPLLGSSQPPAFSLGLGLNLQSQFPQTTSTQFNPLGAAFVAQPPVQSKQAPSQPSVAMASVGVTTDPVSALNPTQSALVSLLAARDAGRAAGTMTGSSTAAMSPALAGPTTVGEPLPKQEFEKSG